MIMRLWRVAFRRGILGGSKPYLYLAAFTGTVRLMRWIAGREGQVVFCEALDAGEQLVITHHAKEV